LPRLKCLLLVVQRACKLPDLASLLRRRFRGEPGDKPLGLALRLEARDANRTSS
jgi:hypothetical protein